MKSKSTIIIIAIMVLIFVIPTKAQTINGEIIAIQNNVTVIKVWGTHYERGYAQGYLLADKILNLFTYYMYPHYGIYYNDAKDIVSNPDNFIIDQKYLDEAQGVIDGLDYAGIDVSTVNKYDVILMSSFLDVDGIIFGAKGRPDKPGCSTLISWGDATTGTSLDGKSVATRFVDWDAANGIIENDVITLHFPSEADEQKWINIGYAGCIAPLSGVNENGLGVFNQVMIDNTHGVGQEGQEYIPVWLTMRNALEVYDYNNDLKTDVNDIKDATLASVNGFGDGVFVTSVCKAENADDDEVALICELAPSTPYHTYRTNAYSDIIPGDNLYSANNEIARNNANNFCVRYNAISDNIGTGSGIDDVVNMNLLKNYSNSWTMLTWDNIQMIQYIPEDYILRFATYTPENPIDLQAYQAPVLELNLENLFELSTQNTLLKKEKVQMFPNPAHDRMSILTSQNCIMEISGLTGNKILSKELIKGYSTINLDELSSGVYYVTFKLPHSLETKKLIVQ